MSKILIINGAKSFLLSKGELNHKFAQVAAEHLARLGHTVSTTVVDYGYDVAQEVKKIAQSDVIIYQMPAWWMGAPWTIKKYLDEVFTMGHGVLYTSDGRTRDDLTRKYGSGGLLHQKSTCFPSHGMPLSKRSPIRPSSLKGSVWTASICLSIRPTSF